MVKIHRHKIIFEECKLSLACIHFNLLAKWYLQHSSTLKHKSHQNPCFIFIKKIKISILRYTLLAYCLQSAAIVTCYSKSAIRLCSQLHRSFPPVHFRYFIFLSQMQETLAFLKKKILHCSIIFPLSQ